ncbi:MAG: hypothetical protein B0W54_23210 [Cellvibrio sp. 79]|nr:MAG: hypothetical protein B0W54_23210 [Cellvibrio sp. 79]
MSLGGIVFALLSAGCQAEPNNVSDEIVLNKHNLQLVSLESKCLLISTKDQATNKTELLLQPPCYFARKNDSHLLQFSYPDKNLDAVALIIGNPISAEKRKKWNLDDSIVCGEKRQAVYLSKGDLTVCSGQVNLATI